MATSPKKSYVPAGRGGKGSATAGDGARYRGEQYILPSPKGCWLPAYSGGRGTRDDEGTLDDEVGNGRDSEYGD